MPMQPPPSEQANPYLPPGPSPQMFEQFEGINTSTTRPGVTDKQMWWCDGFFPLGPRDLRTLYGVGDTLYNVPDGLTVSFYDFINIGTTPYCIVVLSDGRIDAVNTNTAVATTIAASGTITNPSRLNVGMCQWGSQYLIIVANQTNGYFVWDGTTFYQGGGLAPPVTITDGGSGYSPSPTISASGGSGSGTAFTATVEDGIITDIQITDAGTGYAASDAVTIGISDSTGSAATATVTVMTQGISATAVEIYAGRVWVANGPEVSFTAPGSVTDFSTSNGGGNFSSSDSFLRIGFTELKQSNGFLYLVADSSINYISGVQTSSGSPPTTTFTNQNADPEIGTPWPGTVDVFSRNILFANAFGAHVSYGAAVTKISEPLDGVYNTVPNFGGLTPSAAKAIIFGKKCWILLLPIIDPVNGQQRNKLFLWNSKLWFASEQDVTLTFIQHQEIDSVLTAWGTDGLSIFPLFTTPSTAFEKIVQSRLWDTPIGYQTTKGTGRLWGMSQYYDLEETDLDISIDNETGTSSTQVTAGPTQMEWTTNGVTAMVWTTDGVTPMTWFAAGGSIDVFGPIAVGQVGRLTGFTARTFCADMALISLMMQNEIVATDT